MKGRRFEIRQIEHQIAETVSLDPVRYRKFSLLRLVVESKENKMVHVIDKRKLL